jgi:hypothetical protein
LKCLSKCSKWRLSKKRGLVADGWYLASSTDTSISCEFDRHIDILWVRQTHRHLASSTDTSTCLSSSCYFDRHIGIFRVRQTQRHAIHNLVSSTDTSACYRHLDNSTDTLTCYHHLVSSTCPSLNPPKRRCWMDEQKMPSGKLTRLG